MSVSQITLCYRIAIKEDIVRMDIIRMDIICMDIIYMYIYRIVNSILNALLLAYNTCQSNLTRR
jgi:hypothetical protein